jgi:CelD/BcsL family acetyltransferase involved in cellulose biosynthesis
MLTVRRLSDPTDLLADPASWDRLSAGIPFRQTAWLKPWWEHFGQDREAYCLVATDRDGCLRGILPMHRKPAGADFADHRPLRLFGSGAVCTDYMSLLYHAADREAVARAFANFLLDHFDDGEDGWQGMDFDGIAISDRGFQIFLETLQSGGASVHLESTLHSWRKRKTTSWEADLRERGKTQRRKMRRWGERFDALRMTRKVARSDDEVHRSLQQLIEMHQRRWNSVNQPGSFATQTFRSFIHDVANGFRQSGRLHLPTLHLGDHTISAELHFLTANNELLCYSSGYDIDFAHHEPGRLLLVQTIRDLYRNDWQGIDFLRGEETYKQRFGGRPEQLLRVRVFSPRWSSQLRHSLWTVSFETKQWLRNQLGRVPHQTFHLTQSGVVQT